MMSMMNHYIEHTLLRPDASEAEIVQLCHEGVHYGFAAICLMPWWVSTAARTLAAMGSSVPVCTTIGFPLGMHRTEVKCQEARMALFDGARELDMVIAIGALKSGMVSVVEQDIHAIASLVHDAGGLLKVIIEACLLSDDEKRIACSVAVEGGADLVKTSTGFSLAGATVSDVRLIRAQVGPNVGVKAAGGIRNREQAEQLIAAGATRLGTSHSIAIVSEGP